MLRKKWLSLLVACAMVAAMMPTAAFADDDPGATANQNTVVDQATDETADNENEQSGESEKSEETQEPKMSTETKEVRTPSNGAMLLDNETAQDGMIEVGGQTYSFEEGLTHIADGSEVKLLGNVTLTSTLKITANNVTFNLNGFTISGNFEGNLVDLTNGATKVTGVKIMNGKLAGGTKHTLNVWNATGVTLENLELDNSTTTGGAPLIVGSSDVTLAGTITVDEGTNSWYAINVDCRNVNGDSVPASLTVGAEIVFKGAVDGKTGICVDNVHGTDPSAVKVSFADGAKFTDKEDGAKAGAIIALNSTNVDGMHGATIEHWIGYDVVPGAAARIGNAYYTSFDAAYDAAKEGDTVELCGNLELDSKLELNRKGVSLDLNGNTITASAGYTNSDKQPHLVEVKADNVTIKGGELKATNAIKHTLNVYQAKNVTLDGLTLDHSDAGLKGAPLIVNASDVTLKGNTNFVTGDKSWYAADVDSKNGNAKLTLADDATVAFSGKNPLGVKVENSSTTTNSPNANTSVVDFGENVTVNAGENFMLMYVPSASQGLVTVDSLDTVKLPENVNLGIVAEVDGKTYSSLTEALNAGGTVKLLQDVQLDSMLNITKDNVTLDLNQHAITAAQNFTGTGNNSHLVNVMADGVTITNGTLRTTASNKHALNIYDSRNVKVTDLVMDHTYATTGDPLTVAASDVTLGGKIVFITGDKSWYAANVDSRNISGQNVGASLYVADGTTISFEGVQDTGIKVEDNYKVNQPVSLSFGKNVTVSSTMDDFKFVTVYNDAKVYDAANAGLELDATGAYVKPVVAEKPTEDTTTSESTSTTTSSSSSTSTTTSSSTTTTTAQSGKTIPYYTCPACGYHNWTATADGYKCDHCGYIESVKQLSGYGNVKGTYEPKASSAAAQTASGTTAAATSAIPQTSDESTPMLWAFLLMISGGALASLKVLKKKKEN